MMTEEEEIAAMMREEEERQRNLILMQARANPAAASQSAPSLIDLPDTNDIRELCQAAAPEMIRKGINLAMMTDNLPQFTAAMKEIMDRGFGKAEQSIKATVENKTGLAGLKTEKLLEIVGQLTGFIEASERAASIHQGRSITHAETGIILPILEAEDVS